VEVVQADLDAGRDPIEHPEILAWLGEHPESLEEFANLRAVGITLQECQPVFAPRPNPFAATKSKKKMWATFGALAAAAGLFVFAWPYQARVEKPDTSPFVGHKPSQLSNTSAAVLLNVDVRSQRHFTVSEFAPADPQTGAVVLAMTSSVHYTQL
jgi:hypothetical protein